jgi:hypothetical protein
MRDDANRRKPPELALRLRKIREVLYGDFGAQFLAGALELRAQTWLNDESEVTIQAPVVLKPIAIARVNDSRCRTRARPAPPRWARRSG